MNSRFDIPDNLFSPPSKESLLQKLECRNPAVLGPRLWLEKNTSTDPLKLVESTNDRLRAKGHFLDGPSLWTYLGRVVISTFLLKVRQVLAGKSKDERQEQHARLFKQVQLAVIEIANGRSFERTRKRMVREKHAEALRIHLGDSDDFESYVATYAGWLSHKFIDNFNPDTTSSFQASKYLEVLATSAYLSRQTRPTRTGGPHLLDYLESSTRLDERTKLAVKLVDAPFLLTTAEEGVLREKYGIKNPKTQRMMVKDVAERLGYRNPAALSRKLYRVRKWSESFHCPGDDQDRVLRQVRLCLKKANGEAEAKR